VEPPKEAIYRSTHDPKTPVTGSTFGLQGTTQILGAGSVKKKEASLFGKPPRSNMPNPKNFLVKGSSGVTSSTSTKETSSSAFEYADRRKEAVPKRDERPVMGLRTSTKNFITANAIEAILAVPKVSRPEQPNYLEKVGYGEPPAYLKDVKEEIKRENDMIEAYVKEQMGYGADPDSDDLAEELGPEERAHLIDALKAKWDVVNANYQKMTHNVNLDTVGKIKRKEDMERVLKSLEADTSKLEKPYPIYIKRSNA